MWFSNFLLESDDLPGDLGLAISIRECALASQCDILWQDLTVNMDEQSYWFVIGNPIFVNALNKIDHI